MRSVEFLCNPRELRTIPAEVLMERDVITIQPDNSCRKAASLLTEGGFGSLPVVDDESQILGIVSEYDLLNLLKEEKNLEDVPVSEAMTHKLEIVCFDTPANKIWELLQKWHLIRVPVVQNGYLIGIVARRDILMGYLKVTANYWP